MSELYKYKCPSCNLIKEEMDCAAYYSHDFNYSNDTVFKEYICKSCGRSAMLTASMLKDDVVCSNCGDLNSMELWNKTCPSCGTLMKKLYCIPTYPQVKIVLLNNEYYYIDVVSGKQHEIKERVSINQYLTKISIINNEIKYYGLIDSNNTLVLPCIYLSVKINEYGNISVIYPRSTYPHNSYDPTKDFFCFDIDLLGAPIHRYYDEKQECIKVDTFPEYEAVANWNDDIAICVRNGKEGLVHQDGTTIIDPIFDTIELHGADCWGYRYEQNPIAICLGTYGEGLVCVEEIDHGKSMQFFVDHHFNKIIVFDDEWANKNDIPRDSFHINRYTKCHFTNGYLDVDSAFDEYSGRKYKIDHKGNAEDVGGIDYKEFEYVDLTEVLNYDGYEEYGYWGVSDESEREAFDDDSEARWNVE